MQAPYSGMFGYAKNRAAPISPHGFIVLRFNIGDSPQILRNRF